MIKIYSAEELKRGWVDDDTQEIVCDECGQNASVTYEITEEEGGIIRHKFDGSSCCGALPRYRA